MKASTLLVSFCNCSPRWLRVTLSISSMARSGLEREGVISKMVLVTCSTSSGRVGCAQLISAPAPMMPLVKGRLCTIRRMVMATVCQPLAAKPPNGLCCAVSSSR